MVTITEPKTLSDLLLVEVKQGWTKEQGWIVAGQNYSLGVVLAKVNDKYQPINPNSTDAQEQTAVAVLAQNVDATTAEKQVVVIARGAVVSIDELIFPATITPEQISQAIAGLELRGIVATTPF